MYTRGHSGYPAFYRDDGIFSFGNIPGTYRLTKDRFPLRRNSEPRGRGYRRNLPPDVDPRSPPLTWEGHARVLTGRREAAREARPPPGVPAGGNRAGRWGPTRNIGSGVLRRPS